MGKDQAYVLRLPPDLKESLRKEARSNDRSLNAEIIQRLRRSLEPARRRSGYAAEEAPPPDYIAEGETERALLAVFKRLGPEKQLALLSLFK